MLFEMSPFPLYLYRIHFLLLGVGGLLELLDDIPEHSFIFVYGLGLLLRNSIGGYFRLHALISLWINYGSHLVKDSATSVCDVL